MSGGQQYWADREAEFSDYNAQHGLKLGARVWATRHADQQQARGMLDHYTDTCEYRVAWDDGHPYMRILGTPRLLHDPPTPQDCWLAERRRSGDVVGVVLLLVKPGRVAILNGGLPLTYLDLKQTQLSPTHECVSATARKLQRDLCPASTRQRPHVLHIQPLSARAGGLVSVWAVKVGRHFPLNQGHWETFAGQREYPERIPILLEYLDTLVSK